MQICKFTKFGIFKFVKKQIWHLKFGDCFDLLRKSRNDKLGKLELGQYRLILNFLFKFANLPFVNLLNCFEALLIAMTQIYKFKFAKYFLISSFWRRLISFAISLPLNPSFMTASLPTFEANFLS